MVYSEPSNGTNTFITTQLNYFQYHTAEFFSKATICSDPDLNLNVIKLFLFLATALSYWATKSKKDLNEPKESEQQVSLTHLALSYKYQPTNTRKLHFFLFSKFAFKIPI